MARFFQGIRVIRRKLQRSKASLYVDWLVCSLFNLLAALVGMLVLLPFLPLIAILIKLDSAGPVFYRGIRLGRDKREFTIYKLRTLESGAEKEVAHDLLPKHSSMVTRVGRVLRFTKIDELPQLWNVLKGDMNLVGPRPVRPAMYKQWTAAIRHYDKRFLVKPGMTGLGQLLTPYHTPQKLRLKFDLLYIRNQNLFFDLKVIFATFSILLGRLAGVFTMRVQEVMWKLMGRGFVIDDRRRDPRTYAEAEVEVRLEDDPGTPPGERRVIRGTVYDISGRGVQLRLPQDLQPRQAVSMRISFRGRRLLRRENLFELKLQGRVLRSYPIKEMAHRKDDDESGHILYASAVTFEELSDYNLYLLDKYVLDEV